MLPLLTSSERAGTSSPFLAFSPSGYFLPILHYLSLIDGSIRNEVSLLFLLNLSIPLNALRIKLRLHSLAPKALCDLAPLPALSFSSCSLTLYKSGHAECLAFPPKDRGFFLHPGISTCCSFCPEDYLPQTTTIHPPFLLILCGLANIFRKSSWILQNWI